MKRKSLQLFTYALMALLVICSCDLRTEEEKFEMEIRFFIMEHIENPTSYSPMAFHRIDNDFLSKDQGLVTSIMAVQDTVRTKLNFASAYFNPEQHSAMSRFLAVSNNFEFDLIDELIFETVAMDKQMERAFINTDVDLWSAYKAQQIVFSEQISFLNDQLNRYNLSAFHIDLSGNASVHYFHQYGLGSEQMTTVFELSTGNLEVLSFKDIL